MAIARSPGKRPAARPATRTGPARRRHVADGEDESAVRSNPLGLEVDDEVLDFIDALERFKKEHGRPFPSWSEVLHVLHALGYRRAPSA